MGELEPEHFLLLTEAAIGELARGTRLGAARDSEWAERLAALADCAAAGNTHLFDAFPGIAVRDLSAFAQFVVAAPAPARSCYPWILVDLAPHQLSRHVELRAALARIGRRRPGLVLSFAAIQDAAGNELVNAATIGQGSFAAFAQYVRTCLRTVPACRVLVGEVSEAALLADALTKHTVGVGHFERPPTASGRLRRLAPWLSRLRAASDAQGPSCRQWDGASRSTTVFLPPAQEMPAGDAALLGRHRILRSWSPDALAFHLVPEPAPPPPPNPGPVVGRLRSVDLTGRQSAAAPRRVLYSCMHLLGDSLSGTPLLRQHRELHPDDHVTLLVPEKAYARVFELSPDVDVVAYLDAGGAYDVVFGSTRRFLAGMPFEQGFDEHHVLDIQEVAADPEVKGKGMHMALGYAHQLGRTLTSRLPSLDLTKARRHCPKWLDLRSCVVLSRHSVSGVIGPGHTGTKRWADSKWRQLARRLRSELGAFTISLGTAEEEALGQDGLLELHNLSILELAGLLAEARLLVAIDNGVYHLGQAMRCPTVHMIPHWLGAHWTASAPEVPHRDLVANLRELSVDRVFAAANELWPLRAPTGA